jgi:acetoin utilization deacetylase AcuC-like enzyme
MEDLYEPKVKRPRGFSTPLLRVYYHEDSVGHDSNLSGEVHQEGWDRVTAIMQRLEKIPRLEIVSIFAPAARVALLRVHSEQYVAFLENLHAQFQKQPAAEPVAYSPLLVKACFSLSAYNPAHSMTRFSRGSYAAATRAAGAVISAIDCVLEQQNFNTPCLCIVR